MSTVENQTPVEDLPIRIAGRFGMVIRRRALAERNISPTRLVIDVFEGASPIAVSDDLLSFGPLKGSASAFDVSERLLDLGLEYLDDFFEVAVAVPTWCELRAVFLKPGSRG